MSKAYDILKTAASKILGFPLENINYLWGGNKCHIGGYKDDDFNTLCGAGDKSGFWGFASDGNFNEKDGCKICRKVLDAKKRSKSLSHKGE